MAVSAPYILPGPSPRLGAHTVRSDRLNPRGPPAQARRGASRERGRRGEQIAVANVCSRRIYVSSGTGRWAGAMFGLSARVSFQAKPSASGAAASIL